MATRLAGGLLLGGVGLGVLDEHYWYSVVRRSLRAVGTSLYVIAQYKLVWTPENASEVHTRVAERIVDCCKRNEGLYVKFGQGMSSLAAIMPEEYRKPFATLQDQAHTFSHAQVLQILEEEGAAASLRDLEPLPIASASLAQVHRATFAPTGQRVAVKVQKPNVRHQCDWDMRMYRGMLGLLELCFGLPLQWSFDFTKMHFMDELDFRLEASNSERTREELAANDALADCVYVPPILAATQRVLISEWVDDTMKISEIEAIRAAGLNSRSIIRDATNIFAYQIFHTGHIHCDPHPGNLLIRRHPANPRTHQIVLIDHGLYLDITDDFRKQYARLWIALAPPRDMSSVKAICKEWGIGDFELFGSLTMHKGSTKTPEVNGVKTPTNPIQAKTQVVVTRVADVKRNIERQLELKKKIERILLDTSKFPRELILLGRCTNYIRSANWTHGSPIDRVAVMAESASDACDKGTKLAVGISAIDFRFIVQLVEDCVCPHISRCRLGGRNIWILDNLGW